MLAVAAHRGLALPNLMVSLQSDDIDEAQSAAIAARRADPALHQGVIDYLVSHPEKRVRDAALVTALAHGSTRAYQRCLELAVDAKTVEPLAMLLVALLGGRAHHELLLKQLSVASHRSAALFSLGYTGQIALAGKLFEYMRGENQLEAQLAGEAFSTLTGLDMARDPYYLEGERDEEGLPALEQDDLAADLTVPPETDLPIPNPTAVAEWWRVHGGKFDDQRRVLFGRPWTLSAAVDFLERAPLRRRHALGLWLCICTGAEARIDTRAFSSTQRLQIEDARGLTEQSLTRTFGKW
jgi:uncharacterized protein (TIGR02270 family)